MGGAGLEPAYLAASDPKSDVSANFTTRPQSKTLGYRKEQRNASLGAR